MLSTFLEQQTSSAASVGLAKNFSVDTLGVWFVSRVQLPGLQKGSLICLVWDARTSQRERVLY